MSRDTAKDRLLFLAREYSDDLREVIGDVQWDQIPEPYRTNMIKAGEELAEVLAAGATGEDVVADLRVIKARLMLWTWAGAEYSRAVFVQAIKAWLMRAAQAVGDLALEVIELGMKSLVESGLSSLDSMFD